MRPFLAGRLLLALIAPALAQESTEGWLIPFAAAYQPDIGEFNRLFAEHHRPQARDRHYGWGVELRSLSGRFLVGPLFFRTWDDVQDDNFQLRTDAFAIMGELGLNIAPFNFLRLVPMIGLGGLNHSFTFRERTGDLTLDSLLQAPGRTASFSPGIKAAGLAAFELGVSFPTPQASYGVALRAGYLYSPLRLTWRLANGAEITGAPDTKLGGPFFSLGILLIPQAQTSSFSPDE